MFGFKRLNTGVRNVLKITMTMFISSHWKVVFGFSFCSHCWAINQVINVFHVRCSAFFIVEQHTNKLKLKLNAFAEYNYGGYSFVHIHIVIEWAERSMEQINEQQCLSQLETYNIEEYFFLYFRVTFINSLKIECRILGQFERNWFNSEFVQLVPNEHLQMCQNPPNNLTWDLYTQADWTSKIGILIEQIVCRRASFDTATATVLYSNGIRRTLVRTFFYRMET